MPSGSSIEAAAAFESMRVQLYGSEADTVQYQWLLQHIETRIHAQIRVPGQLPLNGRAVKAAKRKSNWPVSIASSDSNSTLERPVGSLLQEDRSTAKSLLSVEAGGNRESNETHLA